MVNIVAVGLSEGNTEGSKQIVDHLTRGGTCFFDTMKDQFESAFIIINRGQIFCLFTDERSLK